LRHAGHGITKCQKYRHAATCDKRSAKQNGVSGLALSRGDIEQGAAKPRPCLHIPYPAPHFIQGVGSDCQALHNAAHFANIHDNITHAQRKPARVRQNKGDNPADKMRENA
jgi:hypothetical protein